MSAQDPSIFEQLHSHQLKGMLAVAGMIFLGYGVLEGNLAFIIFGSALFLFAVGQLYRYWGTHDHVK